MANANVINILDGKQKRRVELISRRGDTQFATTMRQDLNAAQREQRLVTAETARAPLPPGLTPIHAYAILGYNNNTGLVHVWNPHGHNFAPKGPNGLQYGYTTTGGSSSPSP